MRETAYHKKPKRIQVRGDNEQADRACAAKKVRHFRLTPHASAIRAMSDQPTEQGKPDVSLEKVITCMVGQAKLKDLRERAEQRGEWGAFDFGMAMDIMINMEHHTKRGNQAIKVPVNETLLQAEYQWHSALVLELLDCKKRGRLSNELIQHFANDLLVVMEFENTKFYPQVANGNAMYPSQYRTDALFVASMETTFPKLVVPLAQRLSLGSDSPE